jgi:hypothetical protein
MRATHDFTEATRVMSAGQRRTIIARRRIIERLVRQDGADRADAIRYAASVYGVPPTEAERQALRLPPDEQVLNDAEFEELTRQ